MMMMMKTMVTLNNVAGFLTFLEEIRHVKAELNDEELMNELVENVNVMWLWAMMYSLLEGEKL